jgi:manganese oxidase
MREPSSRRTTRPPDRHQPDPQAENPPYPMLRQLLPSSVVAIGAMVWLHTVVYGHSNSMFSHAPYLGFDILLAVPVAGAAYLVASLLRRWLRLGDGTVVRAAALAMTFTLLLMPLAAVQGLGHSVLGSTGVHQHGATGFADSAAFGATTALQAWPAVLLAAVIAVTLERLLTQPAARRRMRRWLAWSRRPVLAVSSAGALVAGIGAAAILPASPAAAQTGGCDTAPQRVYETAAIDVEITINRHGDYDPFGYMYVLQSNIAAVRAEEEALRVASTTADEVDPVTGEITTPWPELVAQDLDARLVSSGLGQDLIQPLVLRARLGDCVIIKLRNDLTRAPVSGPAGRLFEFPGGVPRVSIDMQGAAYNAQGGQGGQPVGNTGGSTMANPGQTVEYKFYLDPQMGEGTKVFRSGGESTQLTAHGLFGALIAEPAGARWFDPVTGEDVTDDTSWSNWEAMVQAPGEPTFREFAILYHEIGDEGYTLRRPLRENFGGQASPRVDPFDTSADPRIIGGSLPMIDRRAPDAGRPFFRGGGSTSYRPGSRALNYRSESFFRRLQHESLLVEQAGGSTADSRVEQNNNKSLAYSSYVYGDPATPIMRSYLGEPTKTRLAHVGWEQLHVHHLHGGATRWRQNPDADDTDMDGGLKKVPIQNAQSIRLDSQTISPEESFTLEHECGAGGCQQAAGDFLYHCHIAHHYISGMWGFWRVFDTEQDGLAELPGALPRPEAVNSAGLLGRTLQDGRTVVLDSQVTDPETQVGLESLIEGQLPAQGARIDKQDATVWDWLKSGPASAPVYVGELDDTQVWENYRSDTPGQRNAILFNPTNGRPAFPLLKPHLGQRPPFSPNEHSGAPWLGNTATDDRPDGLCPDTAAVREYDITAVSVPIQMTAREVDLGGMLFTLNEDKEDLLSGAKPTDPLVIRSNVGDCVAITFGNEIDNTVRLENGLKELTKTNMHTHFVQFDPLASDGVITGFSYEQSVFPAQIEGRTLVSVDSADTITVNHVDRLRPGIAVAVGLGTPEIEIRTIAAINGNQLTFDRPLDNSHDAGVWVTVEFTQHRWFSDVDSGTVFWHDHVDGIVSWAAGLFAAHIIEPPGATYHNPVTGDEVRSGTIVDIHAPASRSVGVGQSGSFREFMIFLHNGRTGVRSSTNFLFGQECEEGSINLRAAPLGERTPPGTLITNPANGEPLNVDPATTMQRFHFNGFDANNSCRNAYTRDGNSRTNNGTVAATVTTVDPYVFSSVKYGDPETPLLRAYAGDDVVIRTIGLGERGEALRMQGHRFRMERFNADGRLMDTAVTGISERFDYVLDGGAGGPGNFPGDYLYYSTRTFALESGAWGIFRVHDRARSDLQPLPDNTPPSGSGGFPLLSPHTAENPQADPGPDPIKADPGTTVGAHHPCPSSAPSRSYAIQAFDVTLPTQPFPDTEGIVYALAIDRTAIQAGQKPVEPLVLRVNQGDCVNISLRNRIDPNSLYGGTRAGLDVGILPTNRQMHGGAAVGLNPDSTLAFNETRNYTFYADQEVGTTIFQNLGSPASLRHGAYGLLIVEPAGSTWFDNVTGQQLGGSRTATQAVINPPGQPAFREFALTLHTTDQQYGRSIVPYMDVVAGSGINPPRDAGGGQTTLRPAPIAGAPPGTVDNNGSFDKGFTHVSYNSAPLTERIGLTNAPGHLDQDGDGVEEPGWFDEGFEVDNPFHTALSSQVHGDPDTPIFRAIAGDRVVFRLGVGASDQLHSFVVSGHVYPLEPGMAGSQLMTSRTVTAGQTLDAWVVGGAGGPNAYPGDYAYRDSRQPFTAAGLWGILRVQVTGSGGIIPLP